MAKEKAMSGSAFIPTQLFQWGAYKANQGRTVRLVTAVATGVIVGLTAWRLRDVLDASPRFEDYQWYLSGLVLFGGWWFCYRLVHLPRFADFLISVEAEMTKVAWPTQTELIRSSLVVILFIVSLAAVLFMFDLAWRTLFQFIGVL